MVNSLTFTIATVALVGIFVLLWLVVSAKHQEGNLLYIDKGISSAIFSSDHYRIRAKPDLVQRLSSNLVSIIEYKSRSKGIYESDRVQMIATTIAVRAHGLPVIEAVLETSGGQSTIVSMRDSDELLVEKIVIPLNEARKAVRGISPQPKPSVPKCTRCGFRNECPYSAT